MEESETARNVSAGGKIQTQQTARTNSATEANSNGTRGAEKTKAVGFGAATAKVPECEKRA